MTIFINILANYGYLALFFLVLIGGTYVPIPAGAVLIVVGALSHHRMLHLIISFVIGTGASLTDDLIVYYIGKRVGEKDVYDRFIARSTWAQRFEGFTKRHPPLAILSSRFIGFLAMPVNAMAGLSGMPLSTFVPLSILGDGICVFIYLAVGYAIGSAWQTDVKTAGRLVSAIFVVLALVMAGGVYLSQQQEAKRRAKAHATTPSS